MTHRGPSQKARTSVALAIALMFAWHTGVGTRPIGKGVDRFLAVFDAALDAQGIDIVPGFARDLDFKTERRPRLAKLGGFPISDAKGKSPDQWQEEFARGAFGYTVAYEPAKETPAAAVDPSNPDRFHAEWAKSSGRRVFVAFTRDDIAVAEKVALVLRTEGFVVFTYLRGGEPTPWANPATVGRFFQEADHHLVIDTPTARRSGGVVFEALALTRLKDVTKKAGISGSGCAEAFGAKP
jgi:hypothetical protein